MRGSKGGSNCRWNARNGKRHGSPSGPSAVSKENIYHIVLCTLVPSPSGFLVDYASHSTGTTAIVVEELQIVFCPDKPENREAHT